MEAAKQASRVDVAIYALRQAQNLVAWRGLFDLALEGLSDAECLEVITVAERENLKAPKNLFFNYQTQTWRK